jgi:thioredoxin reductase (NADPH)
MAETTRYDVGIVGGGVAGLTAGIFTARHNLETVVISDRQSILRRNSHLENYPGFPVGVNARLLLDMMADQAEHWGCTSYEDTVTRIESTDSGFSIVTAAGEKYSAEFVIAATKNTTGYLRDIEGVELIDQGEHFVATDVRGRTGVKGLYAAGRLAGKPHQAIIAAGHGAEVAVTLLEEHQQGFFHDWIVPDQYFSGRGIDIPPGCEEITDEEYRQRERKSMNVMQDYFSEPHPDEPEQYPKIK